VGAFCGPCLCSLSLSLSLCVIPCFLLQSLPVVALTGCFYLKREREREGESQIVQVFAPISLVIFVVLTGFCLMGENHKFCPLLSFLLILLILSHYFCFYFLGFVDVLWMFVPFNNPSFFLFFSLQLSIYVPIFFSYLSHPPTYLLTYLPTYLICYLS
jgi:hypothetical protein